MSNTSKGTFQANQVRLLLRWANAIDDEFFFA